LTPLWQQAFSFAARAHAGQFRNDGKTPYVSHPMRVAMTVRDVFGCDDEICLAAAALHDVIEDTPTDFDDLEECFGIEVAHCVAALTKEMRLREPERERAYDAALREADWRAKLVKLADTYDNLCDLSSPGKQKKVIGLCRRAIAIALPAMSEHEAVGRAIEVVESLVQQRENSSS
jgi:guanosine-3',5'-bis(diphosphate) 3'-pyrophosphohydrolase